MQSAADDIRYAANVSVIETVLIFVGIPLALYVLVSVLTLRSKFVSAPRYRPGQEWDYPAVWWSANPEGLRGARAHGSSGEDTRSQTPAQRGGARGSW